MPRNSSGTYTLPIGAFAPGGLIKSSDHNSNYSDLATAMTQSLATTGVSTMTGQFKATAGSVSAPGISWGVDPDTGFYNSNTDEISVATNGIQMALFKADQSVSFPTIVNIATLNSNTNLNLNGAMAWSATSVTFGAGADNILINAMAMENDVSVFLDGGGAVITNSTPNSAIWVTVPCNMTVNFWTLFADQSGSITVDILDLSNSSISIVGGGTKPSLSSAQSSVNNAPSSWTTTGLLKGHTYGFVTSGAATLTKLMITLRCSRTAA